MSAETTTTTIPSVTNMWITGPAITVTLQTPSGERIGMYVSDPDTKALLDNARRELETANSKIRDLEAKLGFQT